MNKSSLKSAWMIMGAIVAAASLMINLKNGYWKYTIFLIIGVAMMVYGFITKEE